MLKKLFVLGCALFAGAANGLSLNIMRPGDGTLLQIALHDTKRTERALAVQKDGTIYYADMTPVDVSASGEMFAQIEGQIYQIGDVPKFFTITTTSDATSLIFSMYAAGNFTVDWGDGETEKIVRTNTDYGGYSHTYSAPKAGGYTIKFSGQATKYSTSMPAISFSGNKSVSKVGGSLGSVFPTIGDGKSPGQQLVVGSLFDNCSNLTEISEDLFSGITGPAVYRMFDYTFSGCSSLKEIPAGLFSTITGPAASEMFQQTFMGCRGLTEIPAGLFSTITGPVASGMFGSTFSSCSGLTEIPAGLFSSITGPAADRMFGGTFSDCSSLSKIPAGLFSTIGGPAASGMFNYTFFECSSLTELPENLFGDLSGPAAIKMFYETFYKCTELSGPSARTKDGKYLYEIWPDATTDQVLWCYGKGSTGLSDYSSIPRAWK